MSKENLLVLLIILFTGMSSAAWYDSDWGFRKDITVDPGQVSSELNDFPVLVNVTDNDLASKAQSDGDDIIFVSENQSLKLDHEIENYDSSTGELTGWVKLPELKSNSDTVISIYYNNSAASNQENISGVWTNGYESVYHFANESGSIYDSTEQGRDATNNGLNRGVSGKLGSAVEATGRGEYAEDSEANNYINGLDGFTISSWVKSDNTGVNYGFVTGTNPDGSDDAFNIRYDSAGFSGGGSNVIKSGTTISGTEANIESSSNSQTTSWQHLAFKWSDGTKLEQYIDGDFDTPSTSESSFSGTVDNIDKLLIGVGPMGGLGSSGWDGLIDELRISNKERSEAWLSTAYNNQNSPDSFLSIGNEETQIIWRNLQKNASIIRDTETINISSEFKTSKSLNRTLLSTNKSGTFQNVTDGSYGSPETSFSGSTWKTTDFSWSKPGFQGEIGFRIWGEDSVGNWNQTDVISLSVDRDAPKWRNQLQEDSIVDPQASNKLSAEGFDKINLSSAVLSTNETGSFENKTANYSSPLNLGVRDQYTWSNFTWKNDSFKGDTLGWKIWYNDSVGRWNSTNVKSFKVNAVDLNPPDVTIENPQNDTFPANQLWLNASADETVTGWKYNLDSSGNQSFDSSRLIGPLSDGSHSVRVWAEDSGGNWGSESVSFTVDTEKPLWRNLGQENASGSTGDKITVKQGEDIELSAQGFDSINLSKVKLSTNQSGSQQNISRYGSPESPGVSGSYTWTNFTWTDNFVSGEINWYIWYGDSAGNWNRTDSLSFNVIENNVAPEYRNFLINNSFREVSSDKTLNISSEFRDIDSGIERAFLSTNETGSFKNYTSKYVEKDIFGDIGSQELGTQSDFNSGTFNLTSADRMMNPGNLGLGYLNGSKGGQPNDDGLNNDFLEGFWRLDGTSGSVKDYSGNNVDGTINGDPTRGVTGIFRTNAFQFDGNGDYIQDPDGDVYLDGEDGVTVSAWVKSDVTGVNNGIFDTEDPDGKDDAITIRYDSSGATTGCTDCIKAGLQTTNDGEVNIESSSGVQTTNWQHIVFTWSSGGELKLYIDGEEDQGAENETASGELTGLSKILIGMGPKGDLSTGGWDGKIDELRVYRRELSSSEIKDLYFRGTDGTFEGDFTGPKESNSEQTEWGPLQVDADVPGSASVSATVQTLDEDDNIAEEDKISLNDGLQSYSLSGLQDRKSARVVFSGNSTDPSRSWEINDYKLHYEIPKKNQWLTSSFNWRNTSTEGVLGFRIWAEDRDNEWTSTETKTLNIGEFNLKPSKIDFNVSDPVEGEEVEINVTVRNNGSTRVNKTDVNLTILEFNGSEYNFMRSQSRNVTDIMDSETVSFTWSADPGAYKFEADLDYSKEIDETVETDNKNFSLLNVSSYQIYYGGADSVIRLDDLDDNSIQRWSSSSNVDLLYFSDTDSDYSFADLKPLNESGDLSEADEKLNLTGNNDSISNIYDRNGDEMADKTKCWDIGGSQICDIPVVNSTITDSFLTGIMYDSSSKNDFDGTQDIIAVTKVNESKTGKYGIYDYEIRVPYTFGDQSGGLEGVEIIAQLK